MSIFSTTSVNCPLCRKPVEFDLVASVNAGRRPDLRAAILERSFQRKACPSCGNDFRMAPEFTYLDVPRKQFIAVFPAEKVTSWPEHEQRALAAFDNAMGPDSAAAELGRSLQVRCVFGWGALNEKLVVAEAGIDDRLLELAKVAVLRNLDAVEVGPSTTLRCLGVLPDELVVGWLDDRSEEVHDELSVPRSVLADIEAAPEAWAPLRAQVVGPMFVDYQRVVLAPEAAA